MGAFPLSEMKEIEIQLKQCKKSLSEGLTEEKSKILEKYDTCLMEMLCSSEEEAFIKGVRFATKFFVEAIEDSK